MANIRFAVDGPDPLKLFEELTYTVTVVNNSADTATNVQVTDILSCQVQ